MKKINLHLEDFDLFVRAIRNSRVLRRKFAQWSHPLFNAIYLPSPEDIAVPTADFQKEIFALTESKHTLCVIAGFRGSAKTSICTLSFPIWATISLKAKFIVIAAQTAQQARERLADIRRHFENNPLLKNDFGGFEEESDQWGVNALNLKRYNTRIIAVSVDQAIRGKLYDGRRPDLVILDDVEDYMSTRTQEARNKIYNWFLSEIMPLGNPNGSTRFFVLGNFLHEFSLVGRLMNEIQTGKRDGVAKKYPLLDASGTCLWPGMYPNAAAIEKKRREINNDAIWSREYLLTIISDQEKLVPLSYIHFYEPIELPLKSDPSYLYTWSGVDLAISQASVADYTAIVSAQVHRIGESIKIYVLADPIQKRFSFSGAIEAMQQLLKSQGEVYKTKMFIETTNMQQAYYEYMFDHGYHQVESVKPVFDKYTRLALITKFIKDGTIVFPKDRAEALIVELIGFGGEIHDDLVDALTMLVTKILEDHKDGRYSRSWGDYIRDWGVMLVDIGNSKSISNNSGLLPKGNTVESLIDETPTETPSAYVVQDHSRKNPVPPPAPRDARDDSAGNDLQNHLRRPNPTQNVGQLMERRSSSPSSSSHISNSNYSSGNYSGGGSSSSSNGSSGNSSGRSLGDMLGGAAQRRFGGDE